MPLLLLFLAAAAAAIACPHYQRSGPWVACALPACLPARPPPSSSPCFTPLLLPTLTHSLQVVDEEATAKNQAEADKQAAEEGNEGGADKMPPGGRPAGGGWRRVAAMLGQGLRPLKVWGRGQSRVGCALC